jgi:alpha-2-macroglobulin
MDMLADRYQYDAVEDIARKALQRDPDNPDALEYLERIGPAGEFTDGASFVVGEEAAVDFISRELSEQRFELWRMDVRNCLDPQANQILGDSGPWGADAGQFDKYRHCYTRIGDWTVPIQRRGNHLQSTTRVKVPVTEAGNYLVVANVRGRWQVTPLHLARTIVLSAALDGRDGWDDRETWVSGGDADFFLIDALSGRPVEGALVRDAGSGNEAVSDHTGYLLGMGSGGALLVQRPGLPDELLWAEVENIDGLDEDEIRSFLATSQPLYRPGQKVDYAGWLKRPNARGEGKGRLPDGTEVRVRVSDPVGQVIHEVELPLDDFGGFSGSFKLPAEMVLGSCGVELAICDPDPVDPFDEESEVERDWVGVDGNHWGRSWRIEVGEFRKPDFRVEVEAGTDGEGITATVKASYHSGEAVAGAPVTARLTASPVRYQVFPEQEWDDLYEAGYDWEQPRATWLKGWDSWGIWPEADDWSLNDPYCGDEVVVDATGVTDAKGRATLDFPAELPLLGHREYDCTVKAGVQEFTGRSAAGEAWFVHSGREHEVLIRPEQGFYREGEKVKLEAWTLNADREPVVAAGRVKVESVDAEGRLVEVWSLDVETSDKGVAEVEFSPPAAGRYRCTFASGGGERGFVLEVIGDEGVAGRPDGLQLIPRRAVGAAGDLAEVLVRTREAEVLVWLFEQRADGRRRTPRLVEVRNGSAVVSFPLDRSAMPEMNLQAATMVKGRLEKATCRIVVPPVDIRLNVDLAVDPVKAAPGEKARIAIGVTDALGKAVPASLAVAVFDGALEDLGGRLAKAGDRMRDRFDGGGYWPASSIEMMERDRWEQGAFRELDQPGCFFDRSNLTGDPRRQPASRFEKLGTYLGIQYEPPELPNSVGSIDPMSAFPVTPATPSNWSRSAGRVVEMDAGARETMKKAGVRKNFADRAYWGAALRTDAKGRVRAAFDLPDNLTSWRVQAWAFGKGRAHGDAEVEIEVSKPLQVRPLMPQAAVAGDELEIGAMVQNLSDSRQEFLVTMESDGAGNPPARSVPLAAGEEARVVWPVTLTEAGPEVFKLRAVSKDGSLADGAEFVLPVAPRSVPVTLAAKSEITEGATRTRLRLDCPEAAGAATLQVRLEAKAAVGALAVLPDLVGYPHGCTEQTLNRFLPTLLAWQAAGKLGIDWESLQHVFSAGGSSLGWVKGRSALGERPGGTERGKGAGDDSCRLAPVERVAGPERRLGLVRGGGRGGIGLYDGTRGEGYRAGKGPRIRAEGRSRERWGRVAQAMDDPEGGDACGKSRAGRGVGYLGGLRARRFGRAGDRGSNRGAGEVGGPAFEPGTGLPRAGDRREDRGCRVRAVDGTARRPDGRRGSGRPDAGRCGRNPRVVFEAPGEIGGRGGDARTEGARSDDAPHRWDPLVQHERLRVVRGGDCRGFDCWRRVPVRGRRGHRSEDRCRRGAADDSSRPVELVVGDSDASSRSGHGGRRQPAGDGGTLRKHSDAGRGDTCL